MISESGVARFILIRKNAESRSELRWYMSESGCLTEVIERAKISEKG